MKNLAVRFGQGRPLAGLCHCLRRRWLQCYRCLLQYVADEEVKLVGVEAAGRGLDTDQHAATMTKGSVGVVDGMKTYAVFAEDGQVAPVYSISAGLDYPGVGPNMLSLKIPVE